MKISWVRGCSEMVADNLLNLTSLVKLSLYRYHVAQGYFSHHFLNVVSKILLFA